MKSVHQFVEGDTGSALRVTCTEDEENTPINLTNKTLYLRFKINSGAVASQVMTVINAASGTAQYQFQTGELLPGTLYASVLIVDSVDSTFVSQLDPFVYKVRAKFV